MKQEATVGLARFVAGSRGRLLGISEAVVAAPSADWRRHAHGIPGLHWLLAAGCRVSLEGGPEYRFVIVPLASREDLIRSLKSESVDFTILDPALQIVAEDRYEVVPLATMVSAGRRRTKRI